MEAIILAGGFGTRLRSVLNDRPKPMALISGRPFLEILLCSLAAKGFSRVVMSLGYMANKISSHFGSKYQGLEIDYVVEDIPLGTGGAVRLSLEACKKEHIFVFNGDTYLDVEIDLLEQQWKNRGNQIIVAREVTDTARYGRLVVDNNRVINFAEKNFCGPGLINAGCYVLLKKSLSRFPINHPFSLEVDYLAHEVKQNLVEVFVTNATFIDIGVPMDLIKAQTLLVAK